MDVCQDCAMRLFNNKHYNLHGVGNPYFGNCIVVPNVDYNAYKKGNMDFSSQVDVIRSVLSSTGEVDNLYIAPLIRCSLSVGCEVTNDIVNKCLTFFASDVRKYNYRNILLLGDAARYFLNCDITSNLETLMISPNNRFYNVNYSPLIKYVNEEKFEVFKTYLLKWYSYCKTQYNNYNTLLTLN
ncbi:MAG: putative uracyl-DNA glycosylase [crAssphage sp. isolate ctcc615]|uniref:Uracyl-DNA glycosylase n=1 Tax=crAssphage sp. isolate ctcc615 TaxID=2989853 RepID=A0A345BP31_9CAUD|nr:MAG: putative uracyl-DNA glycosylase [crAssphage sp. isolate ctcc615]AXF52202.1 MAG: putative uracyl-DNA glycosylase [crAssphage sp. isolate ctcc615]